ncbi:hypothetical protein MBM_00359 [Drepanopeziza brunnea f. sp. 'multigermtubi' MB_m1]|uniref:Uncharacterized protein n=1 Tax=Marssonina brunnea f. sp. multigermtubi (strain MB_m1) TaxID=1072389 RepID=K1X879_MARBU|nr:uncharacterized protein MBM_00359 [Drepanopeziza brunnea f. sp. 'multigermtubi' MB_m1]EKD21246.1 hypothetical protein MBM_00359 [Drepanopeziza brunnea f. sp. 'multigermtubi' MB_m1]
MAAIKNGRCRKGIETRCSMIAGIQFHGSEPHHRVGRTHAHEDGNGHVNFRARCTTLREATGMQYKAPKGKTGEDKTSESKRDSRKLLDREPLKWRINEAT